MYLALTRFTGNAFPRPQALQRWELLMALLSLAIVAGPRPAIPEKEPLINQDDRARARSWGAALGFLKRNDRSFSAHLTNGKTEAQRVQ